MMVTAAQLSRLDAKLDALVAAMDTDSTPTTDRDLQEATDAAARITARKDTLSRDWHETSGALGAIEVWLREGRPFNSTITDYDGGPAPKPKGGDLLAAIAERRKKVADLHAEQKKIEGACFPSAYIKERLRTELSDLAARGRPNLSGLVDRDVLPVGWPQSRLNVDVYAIACETKGVSAIGFTEAPSVIELLAWLFRAQLTKVLEAEVDSLCNDDTALSREARAQLLTKLETDRLALEREESFFVHLAQSQHLPAEHRATCSPLAILECTLVTTTPAKPPKTLRGHAFDLVGQRR